MTKTVRDALSKCARGAAPWPLTIYGGAGVGKTCAALCLMDYVRDGRVYRTLEAACQDLILAQDGKYFAGEYAMGVTGWWDRWSAAGLVCLDEIGTREKVSDFAYSVVKRALDTREFRPIIVISNVNMQGLEKLYDRRITSRLSAGTIVEATGPDQRAGRSK